MPSFVLYSLPTQTHPVPMEEVGHWMGILVDRDSWKSSWKLAAYHKCSRDVKWI